MTDPMLLDRAAGCYLRAGQTGEAARCYREAGTFGRSAELFAAAGRYRDAAADYALAGQAELAGWTLVHHVGDPAAARAQLAARAQISPARGSYRLPMGLAMPVEIVRTSRRRLVLARCDVAEGAPARAVLPVLADTCATLADASGYDPLAEQWAVEVATAMRRPDQVALVYAAAVRGQRPGAAERWAGWSARVLHTDLTLPADHLPVDHLPADHLPVDLRPADLRPGDDPAS